MKVAPDADPERNRRQALPRFATDVMACGDSAARIEEMPDTFGIAPLCQQQARRCGRGRSGIMPT
jgi:hypothetical protein